MGNETELIKDRMDLAELVGEYVKLKRAGHHYKGLCPFHQEKTPSFVVSPDRQMWHCFGCGKGGDHFTFMQEMEGIDFVEALKTLAERAGVELKSGVSDGATSKRQRLFDLLVLSSRFYAEILNNHSAGKRAKEYLLERGVKEEAIDLFQVGYAPNRWDTLQQFLRSRGFSPIEMIAAGAVGQGQRDKLYDRFRGRIIFPIKDVQGRVVAFGGRIVPWHETGEEGKYINSPETELYEKRRVLYNLDRAKQALRGGRPCLVVEGYLDVVMLQQIGVENVVASSGTALTQEAVKQLKRFTDELHFAFDADVAGAAAALAATETALAQGVRVATVVLPSGKDPADLVKVSADKARLVVERPVSLVSVLLDRLKASEEGRGKENRLQELLPLVARVQNPVQQGEMIRELSLALHLPESKIIQQLAGVEISNLGLVQGEDELADTSGDMALTLEQYLLVLLIVYPEVRLVVLGELDDRFLLDEDVMKLWTELKRMSTRSSLAELSAEHLIEELPVDVSSLAEALRVLGQERVVEAPSDEVREVLVRLRRRYFESKLKQLQQQMGEGTKASSKTLSDFQSTLNELQAL